jgi:hypothetical protein
MRQSVPLMITRAEIDDPQSTLPGRPLPYIAALFLAGAAVHPDAVILLAGPNSLADRAKDRLSHFLLVPANKIQVVPLSWSFKLT